MSSATRTSTWGPVDGPSAIVGRQQELGVLRAWLRGAREGTGRLVLCAGEPGIGKSRLAQELAGIALADGTGVVWGRCAQAEGAPPFWLWRQVLRSLGIDGRRALSAGVESPEDRFRVFDGVSESVLDAAGEGLVVILDDVHWADESSLLVLRHLAPQVPARRLLVLALFRDAEPSGALPRVLPDLLRSPGAGRVDLRGFSLTEVQEQLSRTAGVDSEAEARVVLDVTGGNPLFVREIGRAMAEGGWHPERPPRAVLDMVGARVDRVSAPCRRFVRAAAVVGRDISLPVVARVLGEPVDRCLPAVDEAVAAGLLDRAGRAGEHRFVHALVREAVEESLSTPERAALHRAAAEAIQTCFAGDLGDHLAAIARHLAALAPFGEGGTARAWTLRAAEEAVRRLAFEDGVRLYRTALALPAAPLGDAERCRVSIALGRAAYLAGDLPGAVAAAVAGAEAAGAAGAPELQAEAALVLEAVPDPGVNAVATRLCAQALASLGQGGPEALRARLLAQRSHLAFYSGEQERVRDLSATAVELARSSGDDRALADALHARKEACPGPAGREERLRIAAELGALAERTDSARTAMWGVLWRIDALMEGGRLAAAADELPGLRIAVERAGGPSSRWHLDRATAFIAQAQGRYGDAAAIGRRGYERMRHVELPPARGAFFALQCALSQHLGVTAEAAESLGAPFQPLPLFRTLGALHRSLLLVRAGRIDEAVALYEGAGPVHAWSPPPFHVLHTYVGGALAAAALGRAGDLAVLLERLQAFRGDHVVAEGVAYLGPVELTLGRVALVLGRLEEAIDDLATAAVLAERAGAQGFVAEARYFEASARASRDGAGDREKGAGAARDAHRRALSLGMTAYVEPSRALVARLGARPSGVLSAREAQVAALVAEGLTNRQIAERLVVSERTAQNHVQHILTKLHFTRRSQIAAWSAASR